MEMAKKNKEGGKSITEDMTFAEMATLLEKDEKIRWQQKRIGRLTLELQGSYYANKKRYRIKLVHTEEEGRAISFHGANVMGFKAAPDWRNYKYSLTATHDKEVVVSFCGESGDQIGSDEVDKILAKANGTVFLSRDDFVNLFDMLAARVKPKKNQKIVLLRSLRKRR
jgi:hypothetical protein